MQSTNGLTANHNTTFVRQASPAVTHVETTTVERGYKNGVLEDYNANMQNEHAWAIERKRAGAKCVARKRPCHSLSFCSKDLRREDRSQGTEQQGANRSSR